MHNQFFSIRILALALACAILPASGALPADRPAAPPFSVSFGRVPDDLLPWSRTVTQRAPGWAAAIGRRLPPKAPIGPVTILIDEKDDFVALASGRTILVSARYLRKAPDDIGVIGHELVHMFQDYPPGSEAWLTEGLADYLRYYVLEPGSERGGFDPDSADYRDGYQAAAWLLRHLEDRRGCATIARLHRAMRAGSYGAAFWYRETGHDLATFWAQARLAAKRRPAALKAVSRC